MAVWASPPSLQSLCQGQQILKSKGKVRVCAHSWGREQCRVRGTAHPVQPFCATHRAGRSPNPAAVLSKLDPCIRNPTGGICEQEQLDGFHLKRDSTRQTHFPPLPWPRDEGDDSLVSLPSHLLLPVQTAWHPLPALLGAPRALQSRT